MNTQNVWIKRSEREPMRSDFPIIGGAHILGGNKQWDEAYYQDPGNIPAWFTHWRSVKCAPPVRELTQRETDEATVESLVHRSTDFKRDVLDAIYAERREISRMLEVYYGCDKWGDATYQPGLQLVRARLDEQGAK